MKRVQKKQGTPGTKTDVTSLLNLHTHVFSTLVSVYITIGCGVCSKILLSTDPKQSDMESTLDFTAGLRPALFCSPVSLKWLSLVLVAFPL